jgi:hypothetical protein
MPATVPSGECNCNRYERKSRCSSSRADEGKNRSRSGDPVQQGC